VSRVRVVRGFQSSRSTVPRAFYQRDRRGNKEGRARVNRASVYLVSEPDQGPPLYAPVSTRRSPIHIRHARELQHNGRVACVSSHRPLGRSYSHTGTCDNEEGRLAMPPPTLHMGLHLTWKQTRVASRERDSDSAFDLIANSNIVPGQRDSE